LGPQSRVMSIERMATSSSAAELTAGPFRYSSALDAGISRGRTRQRVRTGKWLMLRRGVLCDAVVASETDPTWLNAAAALLVMGPGSAISHQTAAWLHDLPVKAEPELIRLTRPATSGHGRHRHAGIIERAASLPPEHLSSVDGVVVTNVARTVVDLARHLGFTQAVCVADAALSSGATTHAELLGVREMCETWPGSSKAARALAFADGGGESPLESRSRVVFANAGLPAATLQAEIRLAPDWLVYVDFLWEQWGVVGEADGRLKYDQAEVLWREKRREDRLRELGYEVVRWTWDEIVNRPEVVVARILRAVSRAQSRR